MRKMLMCLENAKGEIDTDTTLEQIKSHGFSFFNEKSQWELDHLRVYRGFMIHTTPATRNIPKECYYIYAYFPNGFHADPMQMRCLSWTKTGIVGEGPTPEAVIDGIVETGICG